MGIDPRRGAGRLVAGALLAVAVYYAVWGGEYSAFDLVRLGERERAERVRLEETRRQVDSLNALVAALESDPAAIEAVARERFGMIREGEILYRFVELDSATALEPSQDGSAPPSPGELAPDLDRAVEIP